MDRYPRLMHRAAAFGQPVTVFEQAVNPHQKVHDQEQPHIIAALSFLSYPIQDFGYLAALGRDIAVDRQRLPRRHSPRRIHVTAIGSPGAVQSPPRNTRHRSGRGWLGS